MHTLELLILAPVPVGHRVEITYYDQVQNGLITGKRRVQRPHHPVVRDLDTGVVYGPLEVFSTDARAVVATVEEPTTVQQMPSEHTVERQSLAGTVSSCRVGTHHYGVGGDRLFKVQTTLVVEA